MKIALIGYGKMGKAIEKIAISQEHEIVAIIDQTDAVEQLAQVDLDVAIEFTQPDSAYKNLYYCVSNDIPVISGTTGWLEKREEIESLCRSKNSTFLYASNFSIGVNLFFELNEWLSRRILKLGFNSSITEVHHIEKKDSPSGTAITLAEGVIKNDPAKTGWVNSKTTDHQKLAIFSERKPNVPGTHTVSYDAALESIEIKHTAHDRNVFAEGVVKVAAWIHKRKGVFTMADFINDN
ncbi:MAG: 4-hydroxy-tetrahydrodipicolinate reductase [Bacteroidota bacterium]